MPPTLALQTLSTVAAPPALPPLVGLIATCERLGPDYLIDDVVEQVPDRINGSDGMPTGRTTTIDQRWVGGYRYLPEQVCAVGTYRDSCSDTVMTVPPQPAWVVGIPGLAESGDTCSAFGFAAHDYIGRATRALLASESKMLANEFWTGTVAVAEGWNNQYLASGYDTASGLVHRLTAGAAPATPSAALALLEEGIALHSNGGPAAIHCTRQLGSALSELGSTFRNVNGLIYTYMGTVIIPDAGYPGSGPGGEAAGTTQWAFATGLPVVRRAPVEIVPNVSDGFDPAFDEKVNTVSYRALRPISVTVPPCPLVAAEISLPIPI